MYNPRILPGQLFNDRRFNTNSTQGNSQISDKTNGLIEELTQFHQNIIHKHQSFQDDYISQFQHPNLMVIIDQQKYPFNQYVKIIKAKYEALAQRCNNLITEKTKEMNQIQECIESTSTLIRKSSKNYHNNQKYGQRIQDFQKEKKELNKVIQTIKNPLENIKFFFYVKIPELLEKLQCNLWENELPQQEFEQYEITQLDELFYTLKRSHQKIQYQLTYNSKQQFKMIVNHQTLNLNQYFSYIQKYMKDRHEDYYKSLNINKITIQQKIKYLNNIKNQNSESNFKVHEEREQTKKEIYIISSENMKIQKLLRKTTIIIQKIKNLIQNSQNKIVFGKKLNFQLKEVELFLKLFKEKVEEKRKKSSLLYIQQQQIKILQETRVIWEELFILKFKRQSQKKQQIKQFLQRAENLKSSLKRKQAQLEKKQQFYNQDCFDSQDLEYQIIELEQVIKMEQQELIVSDNLCHNIMKIYLSLLQLVKKPKIDQKNTTAAALKKLNDRLQNLNRNQVTDQRVKKVVSKGKIRIIVKNKQEENKSKEKNKKLSKEKIIKVYALNNPMSTRQKKRKIP